MREIKIVILALRDVTNSNNITFFPEIPATTYAEIDPVYNEFTDAYEVSATDANFVIIDKLREHFPRREFIVRRTSTAKILNDTRHSYFIFARDTPTDTYDETTYSEQPNDSDPIVAVATAQWDVVFHDSERKQLRKDAIDINMMVGI